MLNQIHIDIHDAFRKLVNDDDREYIVETCYVENIKTLYVHVKTFIFIPTSSWNVLADILGVEVYMTISKHTFNDWLNGCNGILTHVKEA